QPPPPRRSGPRPVSFWEPPGGSPRAGRRGRPQRQMRPAASRQRRARPRKRPGPHTVATTAAPPDDDGRAVRRASDLHPGHRLLETAGSLAGSRQANVRASTTAARLHFSDSRPVVELLPRWLSLSKPQPSPTCEPPGVVISTGSITEHRHLRGSPSPVVELVE